MKGELKNIILSFCFSAYCLLIFSPPIPAAIENSTGQKTNSGHFFLTEISNLVFPQHINPDGYNLSIIHILTGEDKKVNNPFTAINLLCLSVENVEINYLRSTLDFTLKFPAEDIFYPFYDFW